EADRRLHVLERDQQDRDDHANPRDDHVLAPQIGARALLDGPRDLLHLFVPGRLRQQPLRDQQAVHNRRGRATKRDDDSVIGEELSQGTLLRRFRRQPLVKSGAAVYPVAENRSATVSGLAGGPEARVALRALRAFLLAGRGFLVILAVAGRALSGVL